MLGLKLMIMWALVSAFMFITLFTFSYEDVSGKNFPRLPMCVLYVAVIYVSVFWRV